LTALDSDDDL